MPLAKLYFSSALLLLVLTCPLWQVGQSWPVMGKGPLTDSCVLHAWTLLGNITDTLNQNDLFSGIDCTKQNVELFMETNTGSVCVPQKSTCSGSQGKSEFNQDSCLINISKDLHHYYTFLAAQPDPDRLLRPSVLSSLRELMENCFTGSLPTDSVSDESDDDRPTTYDERLSLCKVLKGFKVRIITINRAMSYMNSGEHME